MTQAFNLSQFANKVNTSGQADLTTAVTGTLPISNVPTITVAKGGTNLTATPTNGQLVIGNGTGYTLATLTAGTGVTITNGAGSISIAASSAITPTTGTYGFNSNPPAGTNKANTSFAKYWECKAPYAGVYNTTFFFTGASGGGWTASARIYVNGVGVGTTRTLGASSATYTEDVTVSAGDLIQVYGFTGSGGYSYSINRFACGTADGKTAGIPYYTGVQF